MFITALFIIPQNISLKSFNTRMDKLWYTYILGYYIVNSNELQLTTKIGIRLTHITLSKIDQI